MTSHILGNAPCAGEGADVITEQVKAALHQSFPGVRESTTIYLNEALNQLRAEGYPVRDRDVERLSPFIRKHLGVHGRYNFVLPDLGGGIRALRDPLLL